MLTDDDRTEIADEVRKMMDEEIARPLEEFILLIVAELITASSIDHEQLRARLELAWRTMPADQTQTIGARIFRKGLMAMGMMGKTPHIALGILRGRAQTTSERTAQPAAGDTLPEWFQGVIEGGHQDDEDRNP